MILFFVSGPCNNCGKKVVLDCLLDGDVGELSDV